MHSLSALNTSTMFWSFLAKWWFESRLTEVSKIMYTDCTIILATFLNNVAKSIITIKAGRISLAVGQGICVL